MTDMILAPALMPDNTRTYFADVPLRLWDPGKWSDVEKFLDLIDGGTVLNLCGRLRLWGSNDPFNGIVVIVRVLPPSIHGGRVIIRAGADPSFNANCTMEELLDGTFDHSELALCVLSTIDFSRIVPCDLEITVVAPIPPGASLGTSAALGVTLLRAFLGDAHYSRGIAERALFAEKEIAGKNTGRQDHDAAANGSHCNVWTPAIIIEMTSLYEATVTPVTIGPNIASWLKHTVVTFIGSHDSSDIHQALMAELETDEEAAKTKLTRIRQTAELTRKALVGDNTALFAQACQALIDAQRGLSPALVGEKANLLIETAHRFDGVSCVPGAGGNGGSLISCFPSRERAADFVSEAHKTGDFRFYEAEYPGLVNHH
jgi:galactokinase/mevalonate kinase-like predicted kinase